MPLVTAASEASSETGEAQVLDTDDELILAERAEKAADAARKAALKAGKLALAVGVGPNGFQEARSNPQPSAVPRPRFVEGICYRFLHDF